MQFQMVHKYSLRISATALSFFMVLLASIAQAQESGKNLRFEHLSSDDGLSQNTIRAICQDREGFMWFGTNDGLNRYDGSRFVIFRHNPFDSTTLSDNLINVIYEDKAGRLWIGTERGGLNCFDSMTESFTRFLHDQQNPNTLNDNNIHAICADPFDPNVLWIGADRGGLNKIVLRSSSRNRPEIASVSHYTPDPSHPHSLSSKLVTSIYADSTSSLWIGTHQGLNKLDVRAEALGHADFKVYKMKSALGLPDDVIYAIAAEKGGGIFLGIPRGLARFDRDTETFTHYPLTSDPVEAAMLVVRSIRCDESQNYWLATPRGVGIFSPATGSYRRYQHDPQNPQSLNFDSIVSIYRDRGGVMWIGTSGKGLNKYAPHLQRFEVYDEKTGPALGYPGSSVRSLCLDRYGRLWIGSYTGLYQFNRPGLDGRRAGRTNSMTRFKYDLERFIQRDVVMAMLEDRQGYVWLAQAGLTSYDPVKDRLKDYIYDPNDSTSLRSLSVIGLHEDSRREQALWVATPGAISRLDCATEKFRHYVFDSTVHRLNMNATAVSIGEDLRGRLWLSSDKGLVRFDPESASFRLFQNDPHNRASLSNNIVRCVLFDPRQPESILWVGTAGGGLNRLDLATEKFTAFTSREGLPDDVVYGVLADDEGNLWMSTNKGISRFDPARRTFRNYDVKDGLQSNEFNSGAYFKSAAGEMFFGGINGFNVFNPRHVRDNPHVPQVVITDFQISNQSVSFRQREAPLRRSITTASEIRLSYRDNVFSFEFAALDFAAPEKNQYAYKMEGFNQDWIQAGTKRTATYTNLDPGNYVFRVKGSNNDGVWNEDGAAIKLVITPPWWQTWWAYGLYAFSLIAAIFSVVKGRVRYLEKRTQELETAVTERTIEVVSQKEQLVAQKEILTVQAEKLQEMDHIKSNFFANISHEFRTPLTLILGPIEKMLSSAVFENAQADLQLMQRNAKRLLRLINQLLDLSKLESGKIKLRAALDNVAPFLRGLVMSFASLAEQRNIALSFVTAEDSIELYFDRDKIEKIFYNLLSNACKFTPAGGEISVQLSVRSKQSPHDQLLTGHWLLITVKDTGIGIAAERLPYIFDRFYQVDSSSTREQEGTGIGLALVKELVLVHHGAIEATSAEGKGATFTVRLPLGKEHLQENEIVEAFAEAGGGARPQDISEAAAPDAPSADEDLTALENATVILIVEDNADVRNYIRSYLDEAYKIIEAGDGVEGFEKATEAIPDLVISDVMMPKMNGYDLCAKLKTDERTSHVPVILLTARAATEDKLAGLKTGADDYLSKPIDTQELLVRVKNLIALRRTLRERFKATVALKPSEIAATSMDEAFLQKVLAAVEKHLSEEDFSVDDLGREVGMSRSQILRKLLALTNQPPSLLIRSVRLQRAAELLKQNAGTVAEIAYQVGFSSQAYFTRCFSEQFGRSPKEYARKAAE